REHADAGLAASEVQPLAEQNVIERHVAFVVPQLEPECTIGQARDLHTGDLIQPETLVAQRHQPQNSSQDDDWPEPQRCPAKALDAVACPLFGLSWAHKR